MSWSLGLAPSRSLLLQDSIRLACSRSTFCGSSVRWLSTCVAKPCSTRIHRQAFPPQQRPPALRIGFGSLNRHRTLFSQHLVIIKNYEELPSDYQDKDGLAFRTTDLTSDEVREVFGSGITTESANELLQILHGRRVAGTLEDVAFYGNTKQFTAGQQKTAMEYLRKTIPVDETMNAGLRAEDELLELERQLGTEEQDQTADTNSLTSSQAGEPVPRDPIYGYSAVDAIRAKNQQRWAEEEKQRQEEREKRENASPGTLAALPQKPREMSPRMKKWVEEGGSQIEEPPELSTFERLAPSVATVLLFVGACTALSILYIPPREYDRLFPEVSASTATVACLIAMNALVLAAWRLPPVWKTLNKYFVLVPGMPEPVSLIASIFSHQRISHFTANMVALWVFGTRLHDDIGRGNFLALYLSSGSIGFLASLVSLGLYNSTLGASGAVYGIAMAYLWLHRFDNFKILGIPPDPMEGPHGLAFMGLIIGLHIVAFMSPTVRRTIDLPSHVGGILAGILGVEWMQRSKRISKGEESGHNTFPPSTVNSSPGTSNPESTSSRPG
jgi:rhomboid-like protein